MVNQSQRLQGGRLRRVTLFAAFSVLALSSCEGDNKKTEVDVPQVTVEVATLDRDVLRLRRLAVPAR